MLVHLKESYIASNKGMQLKVNSNRLIRNFINFLLNSNNQNVEYKSILGIDSKRVFRFSLSVFSEKGT